MQVLALFKTDLIDDFFCDRSWKALRNCLLQCLYLSGVNAFYYQSFAAITQKLEKVNVPAIK